MCRGSLIYLLDLSGVMEEVKGGQVNCLHQVQKESGRDKLTSLFLELTLKELVFQCHEHYSIFLLQQESSAL
jgi:hypothetical protein